MSYTLSDIPAGTYTFKVPVYYRWDRNYNNYGESGNMQIEPHILQPFYKYIEIIVPGSSEEEDLVEKEAIADILEELVTNLNEPPIFSIAGASPEYIKTLNETESEN